MQDKLFRKCLVIGIIILFVGACVVPSISGNFRTNSKESDEKNVYIANHIGPGVDDWTIIDTVGWWHFDEGTGNTAYDSSAYDNDGYCSSTQWTTDTPDGSDYALLFSKDYNSYVGVDDDSSLDFDDLGENEGFMINFYMKKTSTPTWTYAGLVSKQYYGGYGVRYNTNSGIGFKIWGGGESHGVSSNTLITDNNWHHIVAVWSGTTMYLYIDDMTNPDNSNYVGDFTIGGTSKGLDIGNDWPTDWNNPFDGKIDEVRISIIMGEGENQPPNPPSNPSPSDGATGVSVYAVLSWECSDPDGDDLVYDVYFEANDPSPDELVSYHQSQTYYNPPGQMQYNTHYYWRIVAWDPYESTTGPVWDFTTSSEPNDPPDPPSDPSPEDGATGIDVEADLSWTCSDPDGDDLFYDVYFEADDPSPDVLVSDGQTVTTYDPGILLYETTYYWRIIAKDEHGASTPGPIWHFTTEMSNEPPGAPIINGPTSGKPGDTYSFTFVAVDPNGDDVFYEIDWGDGHFDPWAGPHGSNVVIIRNHVWAERGDYTIRARAKDEYDAIGNWSEFEVTIIKKSRAMNIPFLNWLQSYLNMFPILRLLFQRLGLQ